jgi:hypothetical protein
MSERGEESGRFGGVWRETLTAPAGFSQFYAVMTIWAVEAALVVWLWA